MYWLLNISAALLLLIDFSLLIRAKNIRKTRELQKRAAERKRRHNIEHDIATLQFNTKPNIADIQHKLQTASGIHQGTRDYQEDALFIEETISFSDKDEAQLLGIVCDGMGGMENGKASSKAAVEIITEEFKNKKTIDDIPKFLKDSIYLVGKKVNEMTNGTGGTTLVAAVVDHNKLYWGSVGDSRIYILRKGEIAQLTRDHNYLLTLLERVQRGEISETDARGHPKKEALISFIGMENLELIDICPSPFILQSGDIVLLCSDGLTKTLTDAEIAEIVFERYGDLQETARLLPIETFDRSMGGQDNISVVLIQYDE